MDKLEVGKIVNTHGLKGYVKVLPWTDYPQVFDLFETLYLSDGSHTVENTTYQKQFVLLKLSGIDTIEQAERQKGQILFCAKDVLGDLPQNTYFVADLLACYVYENDCLLGKVTDVIPTGGTDVYEIKREDGTCFYLPAVKENILHIDVESKRIDIAIPEGLL